MDSVITGGEFRGRKILSPRTSVTHPMGARERLALFNTVGARRDFCGTRVLDAYAGTGALGLEALSRGAEGVVFIEKDRKALECLRKNIENFKVEDRSVVVKGDVRRFVADGDMGRFAENGEFAGEGEFDVIFVDPPYNKFNIDEFIHLKEYLARDGLFVVSHPEKTEVEIAGLQLVSDKKYARAGIAIFGI